ncbi:MAG: acyl-ACP--UDP-N-acetylglucosamine O-acyltransferase [Microscillaceae bacterium]|nr:acyl-ACP--UDP-N-acetylglucosamine O-acyltransferase [Microscillaceae bacterium]MDW8460247.1 acyl-ACP--UDP-N-acetylglucosamine O-acyltransferase [Cytophagales bacterium]
MRNISNLAFVHPKAQIGDNVTIEPFSTIYENTEIGDGTWIGSNVTIFQGARIGKNCKIFPGAVISAIPQDLKFKGEETTAIIGDNTVIRECATINRGTVEKYKTEVGKNCLIMAYVHAAHDCIIGDNCIIANAVQLAGHVIIEDYALIGGASAVHQFVRIGAHSMVGGGSLVRKDIPPYIRAAREPLCYVGVNTVGLRRRGFTNEQIFQIQEIYRVVFLSGLNQTRAAETVENSIAPSPERDIILSFIRSSERGIVKSPNTLNNLNEDSD